MLPIAGSSCDASRPAGLCSRYTSSLSEESSVLAAHSTILRQPAEPSRQNAMRRSVPASSSGADTPRTTSVGTSAYSTTAAETPAVNIFDIIPRGRLPTSSKSGFSSVATKSTMDSAAEPALCSSNAVRLSCSGQAFSLVGSHAGHSDSLRVYDVACLRPPLALRCHARSRETRARAAHGCTMRTRRAVRAQRHESPR